MWCTQDEKPGIDRGSHVVCLSMLCSLVYLPPLTSILPEHPRLRLRFSLRF